MAKAKFSAKGIVGKVLTNGLTGVGVQVLEAATGLDSKTAGMGLVVIGAVLPEMVKNPMMNEVANASLAIGSYKLASEYDVASMLGLGGGTTVPAASGVGKNGWMPSAPKSGKVNGAGNTASIITQES